MEGETAMQTLNTKEDPQADECSENIPPEVNKSAETSKLKVQTEGEAIHYAAQQCEENQPVSHIRTLLTPSLTCGNPLKSNGPSRRLISAKNNSFFLLEDESLPEISMLSLTALELTTNDSVLSKSVPAASETEEIQQVQVNVEGNEDSRDLLLVVTTKSSETKSVPAFKGILETEITLLDASSNSDLSPVCQMSSRDGLQDMSSFDCLKVNSSSGEIVSEPSSFNTIQSEDLSSKSVQSVKSATESTIKNSLEVTPEVTAGSFLENGKSSSESSGQKMEKSQTSDEDKDVTQPVNTTHDISSSSDRSANIFFSCNTELQSDPTEDSNPVETKHEETQTCCDTISISEVSKQSTESAVSGNRTFTQLTFSINASSGCNTASSPCVENKTLDCPKPSSETKSLPKSITNKASFVISQDGSSEKESSHCGARLTFNKSSSQTTSNGSGLGEAAAVSLENKTFDCKPPPQKDGTITFSEVNSTDRRHTFDKPLSQLCNLTTSLKHEDSDDRSSEPSKCEAATASEPKDKAIDKHYDTFEANNTSERVSGDGCEMKDFSEPGLPLTHGSSGTSKSQCVDVVDCEARAFNLDETLDLRADFLITSTPMTNYKMFTFGSNGEVDSNPAAQKKLYDGPSKPADEAASEIPPSVNCNHKTLKQPAVKSLRPNLKAATSLLNKSGSRVPGQLKRVTSGLPLKRSRLQPGAGKTSATSEEPQATVIRSSSYNLRSLTAASKLPSSGLQKQQSRIPFGIPRAASGPGSSAARFGASTASSTYKSSGPSAAIPVTKQSLGKKHLLPKGDAFPASKKKKADAAVPASTAETCDRPSRVGAVKPPGANQRPPLANPQHPVCARCLAFEEKFKLQSEKIQRLEEELLKYRKQEDG